MVFSQSSKKGPERSDRIDSRRTQSKAGIAQDVRQILPLQAGSRSAGGNHFQCDAECLRIRRCPCTHLTFECIRDDAPGGSLNFTIDVCTRQLDTATDPPPKDQALGQAFIAEAGPAEWKWLWERFLSFKREQMETMNLDTLDVRFPDFALDGGMIGYAELFPWAEQLNFTIDGADWAADDQYCIKPGCKCKESGLSFIRMPPLDNPVNELEPTCSCVLIIPQARSAAWKKRSLEVHLRRH